MDAHVREYRRRLVVERWAQEAGADSLDPVVTMLELRLGRGLPPQERRAVVRWLSMAGLTRSRPVFVTLLRDPCVQRYAATGLGRSGRPDDAARLHPLLEDLTLPRPTRGRVAQALGWLGSPTSLGPLLARHEDPARLVRKASAKALGRIAARVPAVATALLDAAGPDIATRGVFVPEALGYLGTEPAARRLLELCDHGSAAVAASAALGLARAVRRNIEYPATAAERDRLIEVLAPNDWRSRERVQTRKLRRGP